MAKLPEPPAYFKWLNSKRSLLEGNGDLVAAKCAGRVLFFRNYLVRPLEVLCTTRGLQVECLGYRLPLAARDALDAMLRSPDKQTILRAVLVCLRHRAAFFGHVSALPVVTHPAALYGHFCWLTQTTPWLDDPGATLAKITKLRN